jgi:hypothetical protein
MFWAFHMLKYFQNFIGFIEIDIAMDSFFQANQGKMSQLEHWHRDRCW